MRIDWQNIDFKYYTFKRISRENLKIMILKNYN